MKSLRHNQRGSIQAAGPGIPTLDHPRWRVSDWREGIVCCECVKTSAQFYKLTIAFHPMNQFFIGLSHPEHAWAFSSTMISVNALRRRKRDFRANSWIMDSGGFTELLNHGRYRMTVDDYIGQIDRWQHCGHLQAAVSMDFMCEPFILLKRKMTVQDHQALTIEHYREITQWVDEVYVMPVIQGFSPESYASHVRQYGSLLSIGQWTGVGSVCRRNDTPDAVEDVLLAIKRERPDLRLHGFGLKLTALQRETVRCLLYSSDSMAWSYAAKKENEDPHDPRRALDYAERVNTLIGNEQFVQHQLFNWCLRTGPSKPNNSYNK